MPFTLLPQEFVAKWRSSKLRENAAFVEHFIDLCHLVNHPTPADGDEFGAGCETGRCCAPSVGQ
jgi:hypothetical protein